MISEEKLEALRAKYTPGTVIILNHMDDPQAPPPGTHGVVKTVDDAGQLMVKWSNGSSLSVILEDDDGKPLDRIHIATLEDSMVTVLNYLGEKQDAENAYCPRCGDLMPGKITRHAMSRYAKIQVCSLCGTLESLEKAGLIEKVPLMEWDVMTGKKTFDAHRQRELFFDMADDLAKMREEFSAGQMREDAEREADEDLEHQLQAEAQKTVSLTNALLEITENLWSSPENGTEQDLRTLREINRLLEMAVEKAKKIR